MAAQDDGVRRTVSSYGYHNESSSSFPTAKMARVRLIISEDKANINSWFDSLASSIQAQNHLDVISSPTAHNLRTIEARKYCGQPLVCAPRDRTYLEVQFRSARMSGNFRSCVPQLIFTAWVEFEWLGASMAPRQ